MKHTHTHNRFSSHAFSLKEARLVYEWNANEEGQSLSAEEAEGQLNKDIKTYVRREMNDRNLPLVDKNARHSFLRELSSAEAGIMKFEQKFNIKFGRDDAGDLVVLSKKHELLEKLLQPANEGGGALDNGNGTYTISTMSGSRRLSLIIDEMTYETLRGHASVTVDNLPSIARKSIPLTEPQRTAYINQYALEAVKTPALLNLSGKTVADFGIGNYERMVDSVVRAHPEAIQYVMTEWALGNKNRYDFLWNLAIEKTPMLLEHLTSDERISLVIDYPSLCRKAVEKNPATIRFVRFDKITKEGDKKFIVSIALKEGAAIRDMLPPELKKFAGQLQLNKMVAKEASATPTTEDINSFREVLSSTEFAGDLDSLKTFIEMRPRLIHFIAPEWIPVHTDEYKELWRTAIHVYPDVLAMPETLATLKQHYGKNAFEFYTELAKAAVAEHMVGQRTEDASYLPLHVDPEWRKERPDDFRALFIEGGKTKGAYSLLMLLNVDGAEEAFSTIKGVKDPLGYAKALQAAINVDTVLTLLQHSPGRGLEELQRHLKPLQGSEIKLNSTLQDVLSQNPDLHIYFPSADKNLLEAKFKNTQSIVLALSSGRNIFAGLTVADVAEYKDEIFNVLKDPTQKPENLAALFTYMPKEWKTNADIEALVTENASLYALLPQEQKMNITIFQKALEAHINKKGALNWSKDVPPQIREKMGDIAPSSPDVSALVTTVEKKKDHKSGVDVLPPEVIRALDAKAVFELMQKPGEDPVSVFASLLNKKAPIVENVAFLRDVIDTHSDVYTFVLEDASAAALRKKPEVEKYIVDKVMNSYYAFKALPDEMKIQDVYLNAALKKYSAADILRRSVFKTDIAFAEAMNAEFATLSNLDKKIVAYGCTQNDLLALSEDTRAEVLQHNISLALKEMTQEQRAAKVKEMLKQDVSPERDADLKKFVASLDLQHAAKALEDDSGVFDFLSYEQIGSADILEVVAGFTVRTAEMERMLDAYFSIDRHEKDDSKKYPNLYARFGERLEENFNRNEELETLKVVAERKIADFELYGDKAIQLEPEAERANKNSVGAWKEFALSGRLQNEFLVEDKMVNLREYINAMDMKLNVSLLIMSGKLEWTEAELKKVDDNKAFLLIGEINQRIGFIKSGSNAAHHQKNIDRILKRLYLTAPEKITSSLVNALPKVPTLPSSLQTKMGALKEKWERAVRDNQKENDEALKRARELKEKK